MRVKSNAIYVEADMHVEMDLLWRHTQQPDLHQQWDLRFTEISYIPKTATHEEQSFVYRTRIGFGLNIAGTGRTSIQASKEQGDRISVLSFGSDEPWSLISRGGGYWKYTQLPNGVVRFATRYDYLTRFGKLGNRFDRFLFRPLFGWATAWSFDVLRIWLEKGIPPKASMLKAKLHLLCVILLMFCWSYEGLVPKLLYPEAAELGVLQAIGSFGGYERGLLGGLGVAELILGAATLLWSRRSLIFPLQIVLLLLLAAAAIVGTPAVLASPFNPLLLSLLMIGLCLIAAWTRTDLPSARHCRRQSTEARKGEG